MVIGWKPTRAFILIPFALLLLTLCAVARPNVALAQGNTNGAAGQMPAIYEGEQFTINIKQQSDAAASALLAHNPSVNTIYAIVDLDQPNPQFEPVINAIQGEGFNPLWDQVLYKFNPGATPHQFQSEQEVLDAAAAGQITLTDTMEVYRCSVVGPGPK
jgi:hypothetical protein